MAYVKKMTLMYKRKVNLGNYNSIELSIMPTIQLQGDEDVDEVLREVWASCRRNVEHAAQPIVDGYGVGDLHGITEEELFLGIPIEDVGVKQEGVADNESLTYNEVTNQYEAANQHVSVAASTPEGALAKLRKETKDAD